MTVVLLPKPKTLDTRPLVLAKPFIYYVLVSKLGGLGTDLVFVAMSGEMDRGEEKDGS